MRHIRRTAFPAAWVGLGLILILSLAGASTLISIAAGVAGAIITVPVHALGERTSWPSNAGEDET